MFLQSIIRLTSPLPEDRLCVRELHGLEGLSEPFCFDLELTGSPNEEIAFEEVMGQKATIVLEPSPEHVEPKRPRYIHGVVSRFGELGSDDAFTYYHMQVRPAVWTSSKRINSRIFQQMTVPQILEEMLQGAGAHFSLRQTYLPHNYCVQYRESDFDFMNRIMEEEGIFYFFVHDESGCHLNIADSSMTSLGLPEEKTVRFDKSGGNDRRHERITQWRKYQQIGSTSYRAWDRSFEFPGNNLEATAAAANTVDVGAVRHRLDVGVSQSLEIFEHRGEFAHRFDGVSPEGADDSSNLQAVFTQNAMTAKIRMEEQSAACLTIQAKSNCRRLSPGFLFELEGHGKADGRYLVRRVEHHATQPANRATSEANAAGYENHIECLPATLNYRPPQRTPRPVIAGAQTAFVVGPQGEQIFTDKYGRVKVQFGWDRYGTNTERSSCWVRVAKPAAGTSSGFVSIPRIGQEVVISFLEGDPDAPLIVGSVHNADTSTIFDLPAEKTKTSLKTQSYQGEANEYSGFVIDDTSGSEIFQLRSQRDMTSDVLNDHLLQIGNNHYVSVGGSTTEAVGANHTQYVPSTKKVAVGMSAAISESGAPWTFSTGSGSGGSTDENESNVFYSHSIVTSPGGADIGEYTTIVFGIDSKLVAGCLDQVVAPLRVNVDVGMRAAACTLVSIDYVLGFRYDWVTGSRSDYTWGSHSIGATTALLASAGTSILLSSGTTTTLKSTGNLTMITGGQLTASATGSGVLIKGTDSSNALSMFLAAGSGLKMAVGAYDDYALGEWGGDDWSANAGVEITEENANIHASSTCGIWLTSTSINIMLSDTCYIKLENEKITMAAGSMTHVIEGALQQQVGSLSIAAYTDPEEDEQDEEAGDDNVDYDEDEEQEVIATAQLGNQDADLEVDSL